MEELEHSKFTPAGEIANERLIEAVLDPDRYPEGTTFIAMTPDVRVEHVMARDGTRLEQLVAPRISWELAGQTFFRVFSEPQRIRLRPSEAPVTTNRDFSKNVFGFSVETAAIAEVQFSAEHQRGGQINFNPATGNEASLADWSTTDIDITLRPGRRLSIGNRYLFTRLGDRPTGSTIFNDHIIRSRWNWQFTPELSVRVIFQYESLLANPGLTNLDTRKNFNTDFLFAYRLNAWTAFYAGYNNNLQNIELVDVPGGAQIVRTPTAFINDGHQFFAKFSYLVRF